MVNQQALVKQIKKQGLKFGVTRREICMLTMLCIAKGYTKEMTKLFGFSYEAIGVKGSNNNMEDYLNVDKLSEEMERFLKRNGEELERKILPQLMKMFEHSKIKGERAKELAIKEPFEAIKMLLQIEAVYFGVIGFYNAFWRYIDNKKKVLPKRFLDIISRQRNTVTSLYPEFEQILITCVTKIGKEYGFDGDLLRSFTPNEMKRFIEKKKIGREQLKILARRRKNYFYLYIEDEDKEYLVTDKKSIQNIYNKCFKTYYGKAKNEVVGQCAYPGKARGKVYNNLEGKQPKQKDFILVTNMTHPKDIIMIKKSLAIVTDEGGMLSHAAITARELKKPCVVGTNFATKVLRNGDLVEVDADKGIVRKLK